MVSWNETSITMVYMIFNYGPCDLVLLLLDIFLTPPYINSVHWRYGPMERRFFNVIYDNHKITTLLGSIVMFDFPNISYLSSPYQVLTSIYCCMGVLVLRCFIWTISGDIMIKLVRFIPWPMLLAHMHFIISFQNIGCVTILFHQHPCIQFWALPISFLNVFC